MANSLESDILTVVTLIHVRPTHLMRALRSEATYEEMQNAIAALLEKGTIILNCDRYLEVPLKREVLHKMMAELRGKASTKKDYKNDIFTLVKLMRVTPTQLLNNLCGAITDDKEVKSSILSLLDDGAIVLSNDQYLEVPLEGNVLREMLTEWKAATK